MERGAGIQQLLAGWLYSEALWLPQAGLGVCYSCVNIHRFFSRRIDGLVFTWSNNRPTSGCALACDQDKSRSGAVKFRSFKIDDGTINFRQLDWSFFCYECFFMVSTTNHFHWVADWAVPTATVLMHQFQTLQMFDWSFVQADGSCH